MLAGSNKAAQTVSPVTVFSSYLRYQTSHRWGCVYCGRVGTDSFHARRWQQCSSDGDSGLVLATLSDIASVGVHTWRQCWY